MREAQKVHEKTLQNNGTILYHVKNNYETQTDGFRFCFLSQMLSGKQAVFLKGEED